MGENAKKEWEWHNNQVGLGYQAKGVIRQSNVNVQIEKVIDMRGNMSTTSKQLEMKLLTNDQKISHIKDSNTNQNEKKHKHHVDGDNIEPKHSHKHKKSKVDAVTKNKLHFDPLMQLFITKLKDAAQE